MRKILSMVLSCLVMCSLLLPHSVYALEGTMNGFQWSLNNKTLTITGNGKLDVDLDSDGLNGLEPAWYDQRDDVETVIFHGNMTAIGDYVFCDHQNLKNVTIPYTVTSIGRYAFEGCVSLEKINLPSSLKKLDVAAFESCTGLKEISISNSNSSYYCEQGVLFNKNKTKLLIYPSSKTGDTLTSAASKVKEINERAFYGQKYLKQVQFTQLQKIGMDGFSDCKALLTVDLPSTISYIGEKAFVSCSSLTDIYIRSQDCYIYPDKYTILNKAKIHGYSNSTVYNYAKNYGKSFVSLEKEEQIDFKVNNQDYIDLLPTNISLGEPTRHNVSYENMNTGQFDGYQFVIMHENDQTNRTYMKIKNKVRDITKNCTTDLQKAKAISTWVHNNIEYQFGKLAGNTMKSLYSLWNEGDKRKGNCECYTLLTNQMLYLAGICNGYISSGSHAWSLALIDGEWIQIDSTNGYFGKEDNDYYSFISIISFASDQLGFVVDDLSGVALAGIGYRCDDVSRKNALSVTIPSFVSKIYESSFDNCQMILSSKEIIKQH